MLELDLRSRKPLYEQLVEKTIEMIINNVLKPDEQLPAVRVLAGQLTVNPNTIQKAYRELEHRGYIYSVPGKGSFVKPVAPEINAARIKALECELVRIIGEMLHLGAAPEGINDRIRVIIANYEGGKGE